MDFLNDKIVKVVPTACGNAESDCPAVCYVQKLSTRGMSKYSTTVKDKGFKTAADFFCLVVEKVENFFIVDPKTGERTEAKTPEEVVEIPGIMELIVEVLAKFNEINSFDGTPKNVREPFTA